MRKDSVLVGAVGFSMVLALASTVLAEEKRCVLANNEKVECPVKSDEDLKKAQAAYESEAKALASGKAGSAYGIAPFDYLTGVGKRTKDAALTSGGTSGYAASSGKVGTELWDRVKAPKEGEDVYNQWTNNWSPSFKDTLVPGTDPTEGKQWYYVYCVGCHGWLLQGDGPAAAEISPRPRVLTAGSYMNKKSNLQLFKVIKGGGEAVDLSSSMPSWGNYLQDQDIWNVVAWMRAMADVQPPKSIEEYLSPKSSYKPVEGDLNPLTAAKSDEFKSAQEMLETVMDGRGGDIKGGGYVSGGMRKTPEEIAAAKKAK
ncbi:MAG: cytochrome c [Magnetococcus sp. DMHC-8]